MVKVTVLDYQATEPRSRNNVATAITLPSTQKLLAAIRLVIPTTSSRRNQVELVASVGVRGVRGISQILFKVFRDGREIFRTIQGVESTGSERNYVVTFQAIDSNVVSGTHRYSVTAQNITSGTTAQVIGPISFSGLAVRRTS